jgi:hypothetical protein
MKNYSKLTNKQLLDLTNPLINKGAIPLKAVQEVQKRGLRKYVNRTINSHDFNAKGNFIK